MVRLGDLERAVMTCLWDAGRPLTVREVHEALETARTIAYTTALTTLQRLARKGLVTQERAERAHRFRAVATRDELFAELLSDALGVAAGDTGVLVRFVDQLGADDRAALREALDD
ncbi:BlaI/MecI/CopY family transcriptional regulator [Actinokineospora globicatena]|uniref:BlaI/MecI/CopY family transcriptional regulator n=1 Tax=Actinokineospora globicatena TaxID=103729 RepID=UPI0025567ED6|nr:BlaI/MecI/CopY family transcriptional regulator [Actinokineospora globicatena]MCP2303352.1 putative transcriptional regulator [Actinokineospora globicatena]